jgi:hypothetical protein
LIKLVNLSSSHFQLLFVALHLLQLLLV